MRRSDKMRPSYRIRSARARAVRARKVNMIYSLIAASMVLTVLIVCLLRFGFTAQADDGSQEGNKYYTSVMITYEMDALDYAREYADPEHYESEEAYLKEVCRINHLSELSGELEHLAPGNYIIIPYYAD